MNIIFVAHLFAEVASGPSWSVPARVRAQANYDDVLLLNTNVSSMAHWEELPYYHCISEYDKLSLLCLPEPFNNPDIVVFEGFYFGEHVLFSYELRRHHIPYIVVPRGSLTYSALNNHAKLKKLVAHKLVFNSFLKHAIALQFLTENEKRDSGEKWNKNSFVLSNGFSNNIVKTSFHKDSLRGVFIGRLDMQHKGIDNLLGACRIIKEQLIASNFSLDFYGPELFDYSRIKDIIKSYGLTDFIHIHPAISGLEKQHVLLNTDVFILTSRFEGHPMGLIEALSYGIPALVTAGTNMLEDIESFDAGWTCRENDIQHLSNSLLNLVNDRNHLYEKGANARQLSLKYDWNILAHDFHDSLLSLINS